MLKNKTIFAHFVFACIFYNCNHKHQDDIQPLVKADSIIKSANVDDTSRTHGLTIDLDYEKYPAEKLKPIVETFLKINATKNWATVKEVELDDSAEGGNAVYYFKDDELKKVVSKYYGETGKTIKEYYLDKSKLIFTYETVYEYNRPIYFDSAKMKEFKDNEVFDLSKSDILEQRSYFENEVLLHQSNNQDCGSPFAESYLKEEQKRLVNELKSLTKLVKVQK